MKLVFSKRSINVWPNNFICTAISVWEYYHRSHFAQLFLSSFGQRSALYNMAYRCLPYVLILFIAQVLDAPGICWDDFLYGTTTNNINQNLHTPRYLVFLPLLLQYVLCNLVSLMVSLVWPLRHFWDQSTIPSWGNSLKPSCDDRASWSIEFQFQHCIFHWTVLDLYRLASFACPWQAWDMMITVHRTRVTYHNWDSMVWLHPCIIPEVSPLLA